MTRRTRQLFLGASAALCATMLLIVVVNPDVLRDDTRPRPIDGMAAWLAEHPADWIAAGAISDAALDAQLSRRAELWRAAYGHAKRLAPHRNHVDAAFVRGGLFHWYELGAEDRERVKNAAAPLLRDPDFFARMHLPLWQLTRDFTWLHANAPMTLGARGALRELALSRGLFAEYRQLGWEVRSLRMQAFAAKRRSSDPAALLALLPERIDRADERLVRGILEELDRLAFDPEQLPGNVEKVVDYAVRHDVRPLTGIAPLLDTPAKLRGVTRARAALDLDRPGVATAIEMTSSTVNAQEWEPYYIDRARFEARLRRDAAAANAYLVRAAAGGGMTLPVLAAARDVALSLGRSGDAARYEAQLAQRRREPWSNTCGADEVCNSVRTFEYVTGRTLRLTMTNVQSDETPPYVEIYVDDAPLAEGEVRDARTFEIAAPPGLHEIEVRLANPRTRNGAQRRVRLS